MAGSLNLLVPGLVEIREAIGDQKETSIQKPVGGRITKNKTVPVGKIFSG